MKFILCLFCLFSNLAIAKVQSVELNWKPDTEPQHWLMSGSQKFVGPKNVADLAEIKKLELDKKNAECAEKTFKALNRHRDIAHWLLYETLVCLNRALETDNNWRHPIVMDWFEKIDQNEDLFQQTLLRDELVDEWFRLTTYIVRGSQWSIKFRWRVANAIYPYRDELPKPYRTDFFRGLADISNLEGFRDLARIYMLKIDGIPKENNNGKETKSLVATSSGSNLVSPSKDEILYQKANDAISRGFWNQVPDLVLNYLEQFPGGPKAASLAERMFNHYLNFVLGNSVEQKNHLNKWRSVMVKAHSSRLEEWARGAHRQGDFEGALLFAQKALQAEEASPTGAALLYITARCQYFLGRYEEAIKTFEKILERHSGYQEINEVKFRRAFAFLRLEKWEEAAMAFNEIYILPESKSYGLSALYWLIRVREKLGQKTDDLRNLLQDKYELTYFGLKLQAEQNEQRLHLNWPSSNIYTEKFYLTELEYESWQRAQKLMQAGWYLEAQKELSLVFFPQTLQQKLVVVPVLASSFSYPTLFSWATELFDGNPNFRSRDLLQIAYPFPFRQWIESEALRNNLNPYLIISLMRQESAFNLKAVSTAQAQGLMQLIPVTVQEVAQDLKIKNVIMDDMFNPSINIKFGTYYLAKVIRQFQNNVSVGLAAYNAGPLRLKKFFEGRAEILKPELLSQSDVWSDLWIDELPWLETNLYVKSILRNALIYQLLDKKTFELPNPVWFNLVTQKK